MHEIGHVSVEMPLGELEEASIVHAYLSQIEKSRAVHIASLQGTSGKPANR